MVKLKKFSIFVSVYLIGFFHGGHLSVKNNYSVCRYSSVSLSCGFDLRTYYMCINN